MYKRIIAIFLIIILASSLFTLQHGATTIVPEKKRVMSLLGTVL